MNADQYWRVWWIKVIEGSLMAERPVWLVFLLSSLFDVISFGLSLGAQSRRNKVDWEFNEDGNFWYCKYSADTASGMAAAAFCLLLIGTLVIMGATRCFCCNITHLPGGSRLCAVLSFTLCWLFFGIAEILLLAGANRNALRTRTRVVAGTVVPACEQIRSTIFAAAASFTFLTWILSQVYYVCEVSSRLRLHPPPPPHFSHQDLPPPSAYASSIQPTAAPSFNIAPAGAASAPASCHNVISNDVAAMDAAAGHGSTSAHSRIPLATGSVFFHANASSSNYMTQPLPYFYNSNANSTPTPAPAATYMNLYSASSTPTRGPRHSRHSATDMDV